MKHSCLGRKEACFPEGLLIGIYTHSKLVLTPTKLGKNLKTINTGTQGFFHCIKPRIVNRSGNPLTAPQCKEAENIIIYPPLIDKATEGEGKACRVQKEHSCFLVFSPQMTATMEQEHGNTGHNFCKSTPT